MPTLCTCATSLAVTPKVACSSSRAASAALTEADVDFAIGAFAEAGRELGVV
jgi:glycine C-acetyltransferase